MPISHWPLQFSYNAVHFALCHIYSGESQIPDSLNLIELATLADMLCLEGLKEVISHTLKVKYCHFFHNPCPGCTIGVLDCLPIAAAYGLDDLYRKSLRWITKYFVKIWSTKTFTSLPKELLEKCYQHHVVHMSVENVLDTILSIDKLRGMLPNVRWAETVTKMTNKLQDSAIKFIADHFSSILTSDSFLSLGTEAGWRISGVEASLMEATDKLPPEQACWSHARLHRILTLATTPDCPAEMNWSQDFMQLLQNIAIKVESSLIKQAPRAARSKAWRQMEPELRNRIQEAACLVLPDDCSRSTPKRGLSESSSTHSVPRSSSRSFDIRQMKIAMTQQVIQTKRISSFNYRQQGDVGVTREPRTIYSRSVTGDNSKRIESSIHNKKLQQKDNRISDQKENNIEQTLPKPKPTRLSEVKSRYLEQKSPLKAVNDKVSNTNTGRVGRQLSSSDSSRTCSPALRRTAATKEKAPVSPAKKLTSTNTYRKQGSEVRTLPVRDQKDKIYDSTAGIKDDRSRVTRYIRPETPPAKTLGRLNVEENMSTDSLATESSYSEKEAKPRMNKPKIVLSAVLAKRRDENTINSPLSTRKPLNRITTYSPQVTAKVNSNISPNIRKTLLDNTTKTSKLVPAYKNTPLSRGVNDNKSTSPKKAPTTKALNTNPNKASPARSSVASPRVGSGRNQTSNLRTNKIQVKNNSNFCNGNTVVKKSVADIESNGNYTNERNISESMELTKPPLGIGSRSGTFLKDEPTVLKKPQVENVHE